MFSIIEIFVEIAIETFPYACNQVYAINVIARQWICFFGFSQQIGEIGKKGWSTLNGSNLSSPQGGYENSFGNDYHTSNISRSQSYQTDNNWTNDI